MAVKEPENFSPEPERHRLGRPRKAHPGPALTPRSEDDRLLERPERHWYLEHDPVLLELASGGEMRSDAIAQRLHDHFVAPGTGEPIEDAPRFGV
jgi:hypothetical protein